MRRGRHSCRSPQPPDAGKLRRSFVCVKTWQKFAEGISAADLVEQCAVD